VAILEEFFQKRLPGWMSRTRGRKYVEICLLAADVLVEGIQQGRLALLGYDPPPDAIPRASRDRGIVAALTELPRDTALRFRRWLWSWRAAGLAGVADVRFEAEDWLGAGGDLPKLISSGQPSEEGNILLIDIGGTIGVGGIEYSYSIDGGQSYPFTGIALGTSDTISVGDVDLQWNAGANIPVGTIYLNHGGRGLILNDLGAPDRADAAGSPAGDESLLYEIAQIVGPCRIQLISADGTWWTREADGYTWRVSGGPWAWEPIADADPNQWARGLIVITNPPGVNRWELLGADAHSLGESEASYGTTASIEWWNRYVVTVAKSKPAHMLILATILNFDDTKFDLSDPSTCPQNNWYHSHELSGSGIIWTRPVEYAWFSGPM
jgi:hypothetical protein